MKLKKSIQSNSVKLLDLYNKLDLETLILDPDFQRKLVWKKQHKYAFIETILMNFPFPEIYIASSEMDVNAIKAKEVVVDGQQRLNTILEYIKGSGDFENQKKVKPFDELSNEEKKDFLNYPITVKDLEEIDRETIIEVFKRINSTDYALNANERLNAQYGKGEFTIFCKQLSDLEFEPEKENSDILINKSKRTEVYNFFTDNKVFSSNDVKRMFDSQYLMLLTATILEGDYFSRSVRVPYYLDEYNEEFEEYDEILDLILNSIHIIKELELPEGSYWFNKANLFTLLIEFSNLDSEIIDKKYLETSLLDLESKVSIYYGDDEEALKILTKDESKYFEVSRHGSHEKEAREHRAKVIKSIIEESKKAKNASLPLRDKNLRALEEKGYKYGILIITETGLNKGIMDAVQNVREFLSYSGIHHYSQQELGPDHKKIIEGSFIFPDKESLTKISMYRANGRGDWRIWFTNLKDFADPDNELVLISQDNKLRILNVSKFDYSEIL